MKKYMFLAFALLLGSCYEPELVEKQKTEVLPSVTLKNGRLIFKDGEAVTQIINSIANKSEEEITEWSKSLGNFVSLRSYQITNNVYKGYDSELPRPILSIINKDGVYQIGDKIVAFNGKKESVFTYENEGQVDRIAKNPSEGGSIFAVNEIVERTISTQPVNGKAKSTINASQNLDARYQWYWEGLNGADPMQGNSIPNVDIHKYVYESYAYDFYAYIYLGVRIKTEFRQWHDIPFFAYHEDWKPFTFPVQKTFYSLKFSGSIYSDQPSTWTYNFSPLYITSGSNLAAEASVAASCIGPFQIEGFLDARYDFGGNYGLKLFQKYGVLWDNIYYCRSNGYTGGIGNYFSVSNQWAPSAWTKFGDFNGDGKDDIISLYNSDAYVKLSQGKNASSYISQTWLTDNVYGSSSYTFAGDFNGDGYADIASAISGTVNMKLNNKNGGFTYAPWTVTNQWGGVGYNVVGDFNGDGKDDIAAFNGTSAFMKLSTGTSFQSVTWNTDGNFGASGFTYATDYDGDGDDDIVSAAGGQLFVKKSNRNSFTSLIHPTSNSWGSVFFTWAGDTDNDGLGEIVTAVGATVMVREWNGSNWVLTSSNTQNLWGGNGYNWVMNQTGNEGDKIVSAIGTQIYVH